MSWPVDGEAVGGLCSVEGCERLHHARGFCNSHYQRWLSKPVVRKAGKWAGAVCGADGCDLPVQSVGFCHKHYQRWKAHGDPLVTLPRGNVAGSKHRSKWAEVVCLAADCDLQASTRGCCEQHYYRLVRYGDPNYVKPLGVAKRRVQRGGYVAVYQGLGKRRILEHRLVMQEALGRPLLPTENVHHVNGVTSDNRLANLELWDKSQPSGQRVEDKVAWAREILARYGDEFMQPRMRFEFKD